MRTTVIIDVFRAFMQFSGGSELRQTLISSGVKGTGLIRVSLLIAGVLTVASLVAQSGASAATLKTLYRVGLQSGGGQRSS